MLHHRQFAYKKSFNISYEFSSSSNFVTNNSRSRKQFFLLLRTYILIFFSKCDSCGSLSFLSEAQWMMEPSRELEFSFGSAMDDGTVLQIRNYSHTYNIKCVFAPSLSSLSLFPTSTKCSRFKTRFSWSVRPFIFLIFDCNAIYDLFGMQ